MSWPLGTQERHLQGEEKKLFSRVRQTLWEYEPLRASHAEINIHVQGRRVRLAGRVRTIAQKVVAEALVKRLDEVEMLSNELVSDAELTRWVADVLARDERTAPYVLQVDTRHGVVTLQGQVPNEETRKAAVAVASTAPHVALVREKLAIGGPRYKPYALSPASEEPAAAGNAGALPAPAAATT